MHNDQTDFNWLSELRTKIGKKCINYLIYLYLSIFKMKK